MSTTTSSILKRYSDYLADETFCIFLFHGVIPQHRHRIRNYTRKHIDVARFTEVLDDLQSGHCISLDEARSGSVPARSYVMTFDDGFENNYSIVYPILCDRGLAATFYITTGFVHYRTRSWTDIIEAAVEVMPGEDTGKIKLLEKIRKEVKNDPGIDPYWYAEDFQSRHGIGSSDHWLDSKLSFSQISEMAAHPLMTIGGHGHTHRVLSYLSQPDLEQEIRTSLELLGYPRHYSYPEGLAEHYNQNVIDVLKAEGIVCCPTAIAGVNKPVDDPFHYRRIMVV